MPRRSSTRASTTVSPSTSAAAGLKTALTGWLQSAAVGSGCRHGAGTPRGSTSRRLARILRRSGAGSAAASSSSWARWKASGFGTLVSLRSVSPASLQPPVRVVERAVEPISAQEPVERVAHALRVPRPPSRQAQRARPRRTRSHREAARPPARARARRGLVHDAPAGAACRRPGRIRRPAMRATRARWQRRRAVRVPSPDDERLGEPRIVVREAVLEPQPILLLNRDRRRRAVRRAVRAALASRSRRSGSRRARPRMV